jgi:pyrimidine-specific ribonucleoside hydrolase
MRLLVLTALLCTCVMRDAVSAGQPPVIVDTDVGSDDLMAIAYLLSRPDIRIEAISVVHGLAHVPRGSRNILRLLELAGAGAIPVFGGADRPQSTAAEFPPEWRRKSDELPGVRLPSTSRGVESAHAVNFLAGRFRPKGAPFRILALGPLTNIAAALRKTNGSFGSLSSVVMMGGAVSVPGNLGDGGVFKTDNTTAEWNVFADPAAAAEVFAAGLPVTLVPLDATNTVPMGVEFVSQVKRAGTPLARFVGQVLTGERELLEQGFYYAWDPLAAVILTNPEVARFRQMRIEIVRTPPEEGRTRPVAGPANARVAVSADRQAFARLFTRALARTSKGE